MLCEGGLWDGTGKPLKGEQPERQGCTKTCDVGMLHTHNTNHPPPSKNHPRWSTPTSSRAPALHRPSAPPLNLRPSPPILPSPTRPPQVVHADLKSCNVLLKSDGSGGRGVVAKVGIRDSGLGLRPQDPDGASKRPCLRGSARQHGNSMRIAAAQQALTPLTPRTPPPSSGTLDWQSGWSRTPTSPRSRARCPTWCGCGAVCEAGGARACGGREGGGGRARDGVHACRACALCAQPRSNPTPHHPPPPLGARGPAGRPPEPHERRILPGHHAVGAVSTNTGPGAAGGPVSLGQPVVFKSWSA